MPIKRIFYKVSQVLIFALIPVLLAAEYSPVEKIFRNMKSKFDSIYDYSCTYETFCSNGKKQQQVTYRYFFKKPDMVRMEIISEKNQGTILLYRDNRVRVRPGSFLLSLIPLSFDPDSRKVCDLRGHGLNHSFWGWFIDEHLKALDYMDTAYKDKEAIDNIQAEVYELTSKDPVKTNSVAKEILWIDTKENILLKYMLYDSSGTLVQSARYRDIKINSGLSDSIFVNF